MTSKNSVLRKIKFEPWIGAMGYALHDLHYEANCILHAAEGGGKVYCLFAFLKQTKTTQKTNKH